MDNARLYAERAYIARTLQESLLPAELPDIPGIEAAARFRPTGEGNEMGGDFYDLFETGGRGWTVVMGDVCGKGPDAAAVTALARYTLRAAAMRERLPSRGLAAAQRGPAAPARRSPLLHRRLRLPRADGRGRADRLRQRRAPAAAAAARRRHASRRWARPGTLLGVRARPDLRGPLAELAPGDALVFYTDGVIEDRGSTAPLDEEGLAQLARELRRRAAPTRSPPGSRTRPWLPGRQPRDDIAVLVLRGDAPVLGTP